MFEVLARNTHRLSSFSRTAITVQWCWVPSLLDTIYICHVSDCLSEYKSKWGPSASCTVHGTVQLGCMQDSGIWVYQVSGPVTLPTRQVSLVITIRFNLITMYTCEHNSESYEYKTDASTSPPRSCPAGMDLELEVAMEVELCFKFDWITLWTPTLWVLRVECWCFS
jgi:hypothetical protein